MSYQLDSTGIFCETLTINSGASAVILPLPGQLALTLKYVSGGSLSVSTAFPSYAFGQSALVLGLTLTAGSTFATNTLYTLGTSEILNLPRHRGPLVIVATGATMVCDLIRTVGPQVYPA